jgi:acyl carrier protein
MKNEGLYSPESVGEQTYSEPAAAVRAAARHRAPESETERVVSRAWARVLGVERVGLDDDFFALGGDSLMAQRILTQVERELGISIPIRIAFANPTVAQLSEHIDKAKRIGMTEEEELAAIIDGLTDEEVHALLGDAMQLTRSNLES